MLDRFPTELISLVIDAISTSAWERKAAIDSLSSVSKNYRFPLRPLRQSIVHVPTASVIPLLRSWPTSTREAVVTLLVGPHEQSSPHHRFECLQAFELQDFSRLLSILPNVKFIHLQRVADPYAIDEKCGALLPANVLRVDPVKPFQAIPADFINQLHAVQVDFSAPFDMEHSLGKVRRIGSFATPVLYSFMPRFSQHSPHVPGVAYVHLRKFYAWELGDIIRFFPDLKAIFGSSDQESSTSHSESLDNFIFCLMECLKERQIKLFGAKCDDDQFVNSGFLDFLRSRGPRS